MKDLNKERDSSGKDVGGPDEKKKDVSNNGKQQTTEAKTQSNPPLTSDQKKLEKVADGKEKITNQDEKVTNQDAKVTNEPEKENPEKQIKPGKTDEPEITPDEKKDIKTKINTSPGNEE